MLDAMRLMVNGLLVLGVVVADVCSAPAEEVTTNSKPNILWISCEDMSPNIGPYGDKLSKTPNLDKLAAGGQLYTRAFSTAPVCSPSRSGIITGVYATTLGTMHHRSEVPLPPDIKTFPTYLREAGYYCTNNVKTDYNFKVPEGTWDESSKRAHWRNRPDKSQPFFAVFNFTETHEQHYFQDDAGFEENIKDVPVEKRVKPSDVELPPYIPDTPITRGTWARYHNAIMEMDFLAGQILDQLEEDGLSSNTMVVFFSDHGMGLPRGKRWLYDTGLKVPLIVRWPGHIEPGTKNEELATLMDLGPTMLSNAGVKVPEYMNGRVLWGRGKQPEPKYLFGARDRTDEAMELIRSVRDKKFKYIKNFLPEVPYSQKSGYMDKNFTMKEWRKLNAEGKLTGPSTLWFAKTKPVEELYDVEKDPWEINNLAGNKEYEQTLKTMRHELEEWQKRTQDKGLLPEKREQRRGVGAD